LERRFFVFWHLVWGQRGRQTKKNIEIKGGCRKKKREDIMEGK